MNENTIKPIRVKLKDIKPNAANPRIVRDDAFAKLVRSIAQFPQMLAVRGLAVVRTGDTWHTIGGNQRYRALCEVKKEFPRPDFAERYGVSAEANDMLTDYLRNGVPCFDCTGFTDEQVHRFVVADNVSAGEWSVQDLANGWDAEELAEWGLTGLAGDDYSDKNKEIDVSGFDDTMVVKFVFTEEQHQFVLDALGENKEAALLTLLGYEE